MARKRDLKPSFFDNEVLAELHPLTRLLFAGMWCHADRRGIIENRPKRLKAKILPFDEHDVEKALVDLEGSGFITRYEVDEQKCIEIVKFTEHQNPHKNEPESELPANPHKQGGSGFGDASSSIGDSTSSSRARTGAKGVRGKGLDLVLNELRSLWPSDRTYPSDFNRQEEALLGVVKDDALPDDLVAAAQLYLDARGWSETIFDGCPKLSLWISDRRWTASLPNASTGPSKASAKYDAGIENAA